jgi:sialate O-acetylesterase
MSRKKTARIFCSVVVLAQAALSVAQVAHPAGLSLPSVWSDHAMVQADSRIAVWGHAGPGARVTVTFTDAASKDLGHFTATVDGTGKWSGQLPRLSAGTQGQVDVKASTGESTSVQDVLVGEVWLASGQSNMSYNISGTLFKPANAEEAAETQSNCEIAEKEAASADPPIRIFQSTGVGVPEPLEDVKGKWVLATADNVIQYSAVAWNFGVALHRALHEPVGLIISATGGTPVEAWMPMYAVQATQAGRAILARYDKSMAAYSPDAEKANAAALDAWRKANTTPELQEMNKASRPPVLFSPHAGQNPSRQYNALIHGLEPYTVKGVIWFQADGNEAHPFEYSELIQAMIKTWRSEWNAELPFYYVEMNNMRHQPQVDPVEFNNLSIIREQQQGALTLPKVGVVTAVDLGTVNAHFPNKKPVGERLANMALKEVYHQPGHPLVNSPQYRDYKIEGNKIRIHLDYADGLRVRSGGEIKGFAIRGRKGDWEWANASFDGTDILLWNAKISKPIAARYAWAMYPVISVENQAGLPLRPFRTDTYSAM